MFPMHVLHVGRVTCGTSDLYVSHVLHMGQVTETFAMC